MMWERELSLQGEIEKSWFKGIEAANIQDINRKLSVMRNDLTIWKENCFGAVDKEIKTLKKELESLLLRNDQALYCRIKEINWRLDELLLREEIMWKQRSQIDWLREGDKNTSYFHRRATWREKKNRIVSLKDENGKICKSQEDLKNTACSFFNDLYLKMKVCVQKILSAL
jgi:hypothetical protein